MSVVSRLTKEAARRLLPCSVYTEQFSIPDESSKTVVFATFDDGPHPQHTPKILEILEQAGARATFFLIGANAAQYPDIVKQVVRGGHTIGSHSWSHWNATAVSANKYIDDVIKGRDAIEQITGRSCPLFRPPYGDLNPFVLRALVRHQFRIIQWTLDPKDFSAKSSSHIDNWFAGTTPQQGNIVLMHDNQKFTAEGLQAALTHWQSTVDFRAIAEAA